MRVSPRCDSPSAHALPAITCSAGSGFGSKPPSGPAIKSRSWTRVSSSGASLCSDRAHPARFCRHAAGHRVAEAADPGLFLGGVQGGTLARGIRPGVGGGFGSRPASCYPRPMSALLSPVPSADVHAIALAAVEGRRPTVTARWPFALCMAVVRGGLLPCCQTLAKLRV
jgi:hypothetical protein